MPTRSVAATSLAQLGWHFAQSNRWDSWFNIVPKLSGGFYVWTPAMRATGEGGPATLGAEAVAEVTGPRSIKFDIQWGGGVSGHYDCVLSEDSLRIEGTTFDNANPGVLATFVGTKMPQTVFRPGSMSATPSQSRGQPLIDLSATPNTISNGFNIQAGASGFLYRETVEIQGRVEGLAQPRSFYKTATADEFGHISWEAFAVIKPLDVRYAFRGWGQDSGYTPEVGVS